MTADPRLVADFANEDFTKVAPFPHPTQLSVMPVVAMKGQHLRAVGTCFAISNHGMVMTARHVLDEALELDDEGNKKDEDQWVGALYVSKPTCNDGDMPGLLGGMLPANRVFYSGSLDIAVMHLNLPKNNVTGETLRMPLLTLATGLPRQDDTCIALGYHKMDWTSVTDGTHTHKVVQSYSASRGPVKSVHHSGRDRMLHFPCFQIDSRIVGGMSGGPVIGTDGGNVIGVVCSGFDGQDISYASLVGPSLLLVMEVTAGDEGNKRKFLYDFVKGGAVVTDQHFSVLRDAYNHGRRELEIDFDGIRVSHGYDID